MGCSSYRRTRRGSLSYRERRHFIVTLRGAHKCPAETINNSRIEYSLKIKINLGRRVRRTRSKSELNTRLEI